MVLHFLLGFRCIALLDYDGNLVTMQLSNGEVKAVAEGVESVVDLSVRTASASLPFARLRFDGDSVFGRLSFRALCFLRDGKMITWLYQWRRRSTYIRLVLRR